MFDFDHKQLKFILKYFSFDKKELLFWFFFLVNLDKLIDIYAMLRGMDWIAQTSIKPSV